MTLEDVRMLTDSWASHPPVNELAEVFMGWKPPKVRELSSLEDFAQFDAETGAGEVR